MILKRFLVTDYVTNCYLIGDSSTDEVAVIDPGAANSKLESFIDENNYKVKYIIITHGHYDHVSGIKSILNKYHTKIAIHKDDAPYLYDEEYYKFAPQISEFPIGKPDILLKDGDCLTIGNLKLEIIHTPGHSCGGISLLCNNVLFSGDTLFKDSVGRTDFLDSNYSDLENSIQKLYKLDDKTKVYPGHGLSTTIGWEKSHNPFVRAI